MLPVISDEAVVLIGAAVFLILAIVGAAIGVAVYEIARHPAFEPIAAVTVMTACIVGMDRASGETRRFWAWMAVIAGVLAVVGILLT